MALIPFTSNLIADVGISMGDEGKGRLISEIAEELRQSTQRPDCVAMVLKVNGGANSGHTAAGLRLNLLPAGVVETDVSYLALGSGVVADPRKVWWEARPLEKRGYNILGRLAIDERTMLSDLPHRLLDLAWEHYRVTVLKEEPRGSTARGISPTYSDETSQWQIYFSAFQGPKDDFVKRLNQRAERALATIRHVCQVDAESWDQFFDTLTQAETRANADSIAAGVFPESEFDFRRFKGNEPFSLDLDALVETYWDAGYELRENVCDVRELILQALREDRYILGEFGQSYWLDKRHGFSPNVTASHTYTPEFLLSGGIPIQPIHTIGVAKAYDTKVGTHTFITQMDQAHPLSPILQKLEFGTSTGRQRMVGWYDAVEKGDALRYAGFECMALNKLDALTHQGDWDGDLLVCTSYRDPDGNILRHVPRRASLHQVLEPVYERYPGWSEDLTKIRSFDDLPLNAKRYVAGCFQRTLEIAYDGSEWPSELPNLRYIGVGPDPSQIIKDIPSTADLLKNFARSESKSYSG
ncbi:MAG TPA: adenylosuccinate synthetase [Opitutales bacterium]|nr:adenylosuccinate synthetase [Opitutales bacterium]